VNWRTNSFKGETTIFNNPRNSEEDEVVSALIMFAERAQIHIFILCQPSSASLVRLKDSTWIHILPNSGDDTYNDYLALIANSSGFLTGMSGACYAGSLLYNKKTLIFDCPWYIATDIYCDVNVLLLYKDINLSVYRQQLGVLQYGVVSGTADILPHDGIKLKEMGIEFHPLYKEELFNSFMIFHHALNTSECMAISSLQKTQNFYEEIARLNRAKKLRFSFPPAYRHLISA
jgi:hypothetical protein